MHAKRMTTLLMALASAGCVDFPDPPSPSAAGTLGESEAGAAGQSGDGGATAGASDGSGDPSGDVPLGGDLPCDVDEMLAQNCRGCHGSTPSGGAPMSLVSHADLTAPAPSDPSSTVAQTAVQRMASATAPMPPSGPPSAATQAVLAQWVAAGMPSEQCDEPVADPFDVDPVCSTAYSWPEGNEGDEQMNPGMACITCHTQMSAEEETPDLIAAGTVFHTAHEPDKCYGVFYEGKPAGFEDVEIHVEITSTQSGVTERLRVDEESGNFHLRRSAAPERFDPPFTVKVLYDGRERAMPVPITADDLVHGAMDCNSCHTQDGKNGAPGRVVLP